MNLCLIKILLLQLKKKMATSQIITDLTALDNICRILKKTYPDMSANDEKELMYNLKEQHAEIYKDVEMIYCGIMAYICADLTHKVSHMVSLPSSCVDISLILLRECFPTSEIALQRKSSDGKYVLCVFIYQISAADRLLNKDGLDKFKERIKAREVADLGMEVL